MVPVAGERLARPKQGAVFVFFYSRRDPGQRLGTEVVAEFDGASGVRRRKRDREEPVLGDCCRCQRSAN